MYSSSSCLVIHSFHITNLPDPSYLPWSKPQHSNSRDHSSASQLKYKSGSDHGNVSLCEYPLVASQLMCSEYQSYKVLSNLFSCIISTHPPPGFLFDPFPLFLALLPPWSLWCLLNTKVTSSGFCLYYFPCPCSPAFINSLAWSPHLNLAIPPTNPQLPPCIIFSIAVIVF